MPGPAGAFAIGVLALAGIPPAAGFFGIAAIVSAAFSESDALLTALVLLAAAAAAFAGVRLFALAFVAPPASTREAREPSPLQDLPLVILAIAAFGLGPAVATGLLPIGTGPADTAPLWLLSATFAIAVAGSVAAWLGYRPCPARAARIARPTPSARDGPRLDPLYARSL